MGELLQDLRGLYRNLLTRIGALEATVAGLWTKSGTSIYYNSGNVGIGTSTPTTSLEIVDGTVNVTGNLTLNDISAAAMKFDPTISQGNFFAAGMKVRPTFTGAGDYVFGLDSAPVYAPSATITDIRGMNFQVIMSPASGVTVSGVHGARGNIIYSDVAGAVTNAYTFMAGAPLIQGALKPTNQYGMSILNQGAAGITKSVGLNVSAQSGASTSYAALFEGGYVGIGTSTPAVSLDVDGGLAFRIGSTTVSNGANNNVAVGNRSFFIVSGATAAFSITGLAAGGDGQLIVLFNSTAQNMTIANQNAGSSAANRIITTTGADMATTGVGCAMLIYSTSVSRWVLINMEV